MQRIVCLKEFCRISIRWCVKEFGREPKMQRVFSSLVTAAVFSGGDMGRGVNTARCSLSSATSHLSPSRLRNGNGCQITGGFCRYQVCFKEVFLPGYDGFHEICRDNFGNFLPFRTWPLWEMCGQKAQGGRGGQSWRRSKIGSSSSCGPETGRGERRGFLRIFPSCGAERIWK